MIGPLLDNHQRDINAILCDSLETEKCASALQHDLLVEVEGHPVMLEEYSRQMIYAELRHAGEVEKMLCKPGEVVAFVKGSPA